MTETRKIGGYLFELEPRYAEGHVCTAIEANVLNQTLFENVGNNWRSSIVEMEDENEKNGGNKALTEEQLAKMKADILADSREYQFGQRSTRASTPRDPVLAEAIKIAKDDIRLHLRNQDPPLTVKAYIESLDKQFGEGEGKKRFDAAVMRNAQAPARMEKAAKLVAAAQKLAKQVVDVEL